MLTENRRACCFSYRDFICNGTLHCWSCRARAGKGEAGKQWHSVMYKRHDVVVVYEHSASLTNSRTTSSKDRHSAQHILRLLEELRSHILSRRSFTINMKLSAVAIVLGATIVSGASVSYDAVRKLTALAAQYPLTHHRATTMPPAP